MREGMRVLFLTRHGDIRAGWKLLLFLICTAALGTVLVGGAGKLFGAIPFVDRFLALAAVLITSWILTRTVNRKPFPAIGLWMHPKAGRELGMGLLLGFLMMSGIFLVQLAAGYVAVTWRSLSWDAVVITMALSLLSFAPAAATEELLFRGYPFQTLAQGLTMLPAILTMSGLFGIAHAWNPNATLLSTANVILAGIWLSLAYLKTRGLWLPFGLHLSWNFTQTTVYGFPTSGLEFVDHQIWSSAQQGPDWITGGAFGPEGGVLAAVALLAGTWYVMKSALLRAPEGIVTLDTVEDIIPPLAASDAEPAP
jgi:membrane protease YdiL (CAAX protease family)